MTVADVVVVFATAVVVAGLGRFFFGPRRARVAELAGGVQRVAVTVRGGYSPDVIRLRQNVPAELVFDRQETGECTSRVVFADLGMSAALPAFTRTPVRLNPTRAGKFGFACGMNVIHGTLVVEPAGRADTADDTAESAVAAGSHGPASTGGGGPEAGAAEVEAAQAKERRAEIADLTRRVVVGAVLTAPVLFAAASSARTA